MIDRQNIYSKIFNEGLMLPYKKFPDRYFDYYTDREFPKSEINEHPQWYKEEYDNNGNEIYYESFKGYWIKKEYDNNENQIYWEDSNGDWEKLEYDSNGNLIYKEYSSGYWEKYEYDNNGQRIYYEDSWNGVTLDNRNHIQEGLMLEYKKFPDRYFDDRTDKEFPKSEINKHPSWRKKEYDENGNVVYYENGDGYWAKREYDADENETYYENSFGDWSKKEYDENGNVVYYENGDGYWEKWEYDADGNEVYYENRDGQIDDFRNRIQEGLMLPYKQKINFIELSDQFEIFDNNGDFNTFFFETENDPGRQTIEIKLSFDLPDDNITNAIEGTLFWHEHDPYNIQFYIHRLFNDFEDEEEIFSDKISINNISTVAQELKDYMSHINNNIMPRLL